MIKRVYLPLTRPVPTTLMRFINDGPQERPRIEQGEAIRLAKDELGKKWASVRLVATGRQSEELQWADFDLEGER